MSQRFFVDKIISGDTANLVGQEAQHLLKVMRADVGDELIVFDGSGDEFTAIVSGISRSDVDVTIVQRRSIERELDFRLTLGVALPKGDRQRWLIEKLTELGVTRLVPLVTTRGVAQPSEQALVRLQRFVIEASKQCGRNRLMEIAPPQTCRDFLTETAEHRLRLLAHPSDAALPALPERKLRDVDVGIGPEGGFTEEEVLPAMTAGWQCVSLGTRILRVETAAIAIAAALSLRG